MKAPMVTKVRLVKRTRKGLSFWAFRSRFCLYAAFLREQFILSETKVILLIRRWIRVIFKGILNDTTARHLQYDPGTTSSYTTLKQSHDEEYNHIEEASCLWCYLCYPLSLFSLIIILPFLSRQMIRDTLDRILRPKMNLRIG
jgi:hypothetical protein